MEAPDTKRIYKECQTVIAKLKRPIEDYDRQLKQFAIPNEFFKK